MVQVRPGSGPGRVGSIDPIDLCSVLVSLSSEPVVLRSLQLIYLMAGELWPGHRPGHPAVCRLEFFFIYLNRSCQVAIRFTLHKPSFALVSVYIGLARARNRFDNCQLYPTCEEKQVLVLRCTNMELAVHCFCCLCSAKRESIGGNASRSSVSGHFRLSCLALSLSLSCELSPVFPSPSFFLVRLSLWFFCVFRRVPYFWCCLGRGRFLHPCLRENGWLGVLQSQTLLICACMQPRNAERDVAKCTSLVDSHANDTFAPRHVARLSFFSCPPLPQSFLTGPGEMSMGQGPVEDGGQLGPLLERPFPFPFPSTEKERLARQQARRGGEQERDAGYARYAGGQECRKRRKRQNRKKGGREESEERERTTQEEGGVGRHEPMALRLGREERPARLFWLWLFLSSFLCRSFASSLR